MKHRQLRVNEVVKRELSGIIAREINFEGALVSINAVDVSPDLKSAHVFVSTLGANNLASVIDKLEAHRHRDEHDLAQQTADVREGRGRSLRKSCYSLVLAGGFSRSSKISSTRAPRWMDSSR